VSDGTTQGTQLFANMHLAEGNFSPVGLTLSAGRLFLTASLPHIGSELWIVDRPGASVHAVGDPCGASSPRLTATPPILGGATTVMGRRAPSSWVGVNLLGVRAVPPLSLGTGCYSYLDLNQFVVLNAFVATQPTWSVTVSVPNDNRLEGALAAVQTWFLTTSFPMRTQLTNGVYLGPSH